MESFEKPGLNFQYTKIIGKTDIIRMHNFVNSAQFVLTYTSILFFDGLAYDLDSTLMEIDSDNDSRTSVCTWTEESFAPAADYIPPPESSASGLVTQIKICFLFRLYHF